MHGLQALDNQTQKLFEAIDETDLAKFKQALEEGANVNTFDEEGMTPLMSLANIYTVSGNDAQFTLKKMAKLLIQNKDIDINTQQYMPQEIWGHYYNAQPRFTTTSNMYKDTALHIACRFGAQDIVKILLTHLNVETNIKNNENKTPENCITRGFEVVIKKEIQKARSGGQLLNALKRNNIESAKRLLNEELNPNCWERTLDERIKTSFDYIIQLCSQEITQDKKDVLSKFLKHKDLDFSQIKPIPEIECNSELNLVIRQTIIERLTDAINRRDLGDVKELVEDNCLMNHTIVIAALKDVGNPIESIQSYLNEKFAASSSVAQPVANEHNITHTNDLVLAQELQQLENVREELLRTKTLLTKKEQDLAGVKRNLDEKTRKISGQNRNISNQQTHINNLTSKIDQLNIKKNQLSSRLQELNNIQEELVQAKQQLRHEQWKYSDQQTGIDGLTSQVGQLNREKNQLRKQNNDLSNKNNNSRKQSNYAAASFVLSGTFAIGVCLTISDPLIWTSLATAALILFAAGCYCLYQANTALSDIKSAQVTENVLGF